MLTRLAVTKRWHTAPMRIVLSSGLVCLSLVALAWFGFLQKTQAAENLLLQHQVSKAPTSPQPELVANYGKLPLSFEANHGQVSGPVKFLTRGPGYTLFLDTQDMVLELAQPSAGTGQNPELKNRKAAGNAGQSATYNAPAPGDSVLRMQLLDASANATVTGAEELPGKSNYFIGNDPAKWRTDVPNYAQVKYQNVYPGVNLVYYGTQGGQLEYDFIVAPGADPHAIGISFQGAGHPRVDKTTGDLVMTLDGNELRFRKPVVYQEGPSGVRSPRSEDQDESRNPSLRQSTLGNRQFLDGRFVLTGKNQIGFQVAAYDHSAPLIIDPVLIYSTYLGGGKLTFGIRVAVDARRRRNLGRRWLLYVLRRRRSRGNNQFRHLIVLLDHVLGHHAREQERDKNRHVQNSMYYK